MVADLVVVEIKAVDRLLPIHEAQLLTYMKLARRQLGLLINFNVPLIKDGITRVLNLDFQTEAGSEANLGSALRVFAS